MGLNEDITELNARARIIAGLLQQNLRDVTYSLQDGRFTILSARLSKAQHDRCKHTNGLVEQALLFIYRQESLSAVRNNEPNGEEIARVLALRDAKASFDGDTWMADAEGRELGKTIQYMLSKYKGILQKKDELYPAYRLST